MRYSIIHRLMRMFAFLIPILVFLGFTMFTLFLFSNSYSSFIHSILHKIHRPDIYEKVTTLYFTAHKFDQLKIVMSAVLIILFIALFFLLRHRKKYVNFIDEILYSCEKYFSKGSEILSSFSKQGKWMIVILFLLILARSIYYSNTFYIQHDEAWNYNLFLDQGLYYSIGAYNNYPLHNIISWCFVHSLGNSVFVLRLPSILFGLATVLLLVISIQYFLKNEWITICIPLLFACMPVSVFYMMYARGVMLEIFFSILIMSLFLYFIQNEFTYRRIFLLACLNALATYSMLSHPYFILATSIGFFIYALRMSKDLIQKSIVYGGFSFLLSYGLLVPMQLGTGLTPGLSASFGFNRISLIDFLNHIKLYASFITGFSQLFYVFFLILIVLLIQNFSKKNTVYFVALINLSLLLLMILVPLLTNIFPPERAFGFLIIVPISMLCLLYFKIRDMQFGKIILAVFTTSFVFLFSYKSHTHHFLNWSKKLDLQVYELFQVLKSNKIDTVYGECIDAYYFAPGIDFYFKQIGKRFVYVSSSKQSTRYASLPDTTIECLIVCKDKQLQLPLNTKLIYETKEIIVCKKMH